MAINGLSLRVVPHENYRARDLNLNANEASKKKKRIVIDAVYITEKYIMKKPGN